MVTQALYLALLAAVALERLWELRLSRRNLRALATRGAVEVGQAHFRVMVVVHTAFLFACAVEVLLMNRTFVLAVGVPALVLVLLAQALRYWAIGSLGERWNTRIVVLPDAQPVVTGPYRFVRHPNYVAVCVEFVALPLVCSAYLTAIVFSAANVLLLYVRIRAEEQALGARWATAFARTPRFLPGGE